MLLYRVSRVQTLYHVWVKSNNPRWSHGDLKLQNFGSVLSRIWPQVAFRSSAISGCHTAPVYQISIQHSQPKRGWVIDDLTNFTARFSAWAILYTWILTVGGSAPNQILEQMGQWLALLSHCMDFICCYLSKAELIYSRQVQKYGPNFVHFYSSCKIGGGMDEIYEAEFQIQLGTQSLIFWCGVAAWAGRWNTFSRLNMRDLRVGSTLYQLWNENTLSVRFLDFRCSASFRNYRAPKAKIRKNTKYLTPVKLGKG